MHKKMKRRSNEFDFFFFTEYILFYSNVSIKIKQEDNFFGGKIGSRVYYTH